MTLISPSYAWYQAITYRMLNLSLLCCGLLFVCTAKANSFAESHQPEQLLRNQISQLFMASELNPELRIAKLRAVQELAIEQHFQRAEIESAAGQAYEYASLENTKKSQEISSQYLNLAQELNLYRATIWLLSANLRHYATQNNFDASHEIQVQLLDMLNLDLKAKDRARVLYEVAHSEHRMDMNRAALIHLKSALDLTSDNPNSSISFDIMSLIGSIHTSTGNFEQAILAFQRVSRIHEKLNGSDWDLSIILYNLGDVYLASGQYELADQNLNAALAISQKLNDEIGIAYSLLRLAELAGKHHQYDKSFEFGAAAKQIFLENDEYQMAIQCGIVEAKALIAAGQYRLADQLLVEMEPWVESYSRGALVADYAHIQYRLAKSQKDHLKAIRYLEISSKSRLERERKKRDEGFQRTMVELNVELTESENRYLQQQDELNAERLERAESERLVFLLSTILVGVGLVAGGFVLFNQVSSRKEYEHLAMRDTLTKAFNRRAIMMRAENHFKESTEHDMPFSIGLIDLDNFKKVNDVYGHDVGDEVLKAFADTLRETIRKHDRFGRYGGEEWLVIFPETSILSIRYVYRRLQDKLRDLEIKGLPEGYRISCSMGAAERRSHTRSLDEMIKRADMRLYHAKNHGKDQLVVKSDE